MTGRRAFLFATTSLLACRRAPRALTLRARAPEGGSAVAPGAGVLLLATLPRAARRELVEAVDALLASLEARRNPLLIDVAETSPRELFAARKAWLGPCARVARETARNAYPLFSPGTAGAAERVVVAGPPGSGTVPALGDRDGPDDAATLRRAAWPVSGAFVVETTSSDGATRAQAALASLAVQENGLVGGLWTDASARAVSADVPNDLLARGARWGRSFPAAVPGANETDEARALRELAQLFVPPPVQGLLPFWERAPTDVLVLPRRGALARTGELRGALERTLREAFPAGGAILRK